MNIFASILLVYSLLLATTELHAVPTGRIVGGDDAYNGQFPHQISLRLDGSHHCGGSIITRNYIITAAHCVSSYQPSRFTIRAGSVDRLQYGILANISAITVHAEYGNSINDVALLKLQQPLIFSDNIKPITLTSEPVPVGVTVQISGWGRLKSFGEIPIMLKWTNASVMSRAACGDLSPSFDTDRLVCLAHAVNTGACDGDSGGPATYNGTLMGITSFTIGRCGSDLPDGYAQVSFFYDWVLQYSDLLEFIEEHSEY